MVSIFCGTQDKLLQTMKNKISLAFHAVYNINKKENTIKIKKIG